MGAPSIVFVEHRRLVMGDRDVLYRLYNCEISGCKAVALGAGKAENEVEGGGNLGTILVRWMQFEVCYIDTVVLRHCLYSTLYR